jgi:hypothetical protein
LLTPLQNATRRWLNARLPLETASPTDFAREAGIRWRPELLHAAHHPRRAIHARTHFGRLDALSGTPGVGLLSRTARASPSTSIPNLPGSARPVDYTEGATGFTRAQRQLSSSLPPSHSASQTASLASSNPSRSLPQRYHTKTASSLKALIIQSRDAPHLSQTSVLSSSPPYRDDHELMSTHKHSFRATSRAPLNISAAAGTVPSNRISRRLLSDHDIKTALKLKDFCSEGREFELSRSTASASNHRQDKSSVLVEGKTHPPVLSSHATVSSSVAQSHPGAILSHTPSTQLMGRPVASSTRRIFSPISGDLITDVKHGTLPPPTPEEPFVANTPVTLFDVSMCSEAHATSISSSSSPMSMGDLIQKPLPLSPSTICGASLSHQSTTFQHSSTVTSACTEVEMDIVCSLVAGHEPDVVMAGSHPDATIPHRDDCFHSERRWKGYAWVDDEQSTSSTLVSVVTVLPRRTTRSGHVFG